MDMKLIDKAAVVAEIKRLILANELYLSSPETDEVRFQKTGAYSVCNDLLHFLDTLEVREVDLDLEITLWANAIPEIRLDDVRRLAKYFFELGLKIQYSSINNSNIDNPYED